MSWSRRSLHIGVSAVGVGASSLHSPGVIAAARPTLVLDLGAACNFLCLFLVSVSCNLSYVASLIQSPAHFEPTV